MTAATAQTAKTAKTAARGPAAGTFSAEERAAMADRVREAKAASRKGGPDRAEGEREVLAKIAELPDPDRSMAQRVHELVTGAAPDLWPRTYYGMPAYSRDGKVICFFKPKSKFKVRYATFEFNPDARLDDGTMWPVSFALTELTPGNEARIVELVRAASA